MIILHVLPLFQKYNLLISTMTKPVASNQSTLVLRDTLLRHHANSKRRHLTLLSFCKEVNERDVAKQESKKKALTLKKGSGL